MLKWKYYKQLSKEDKEEWYFKYGNLNPPHLSLWGIISMLFVMIHFSFLALIIFKEYVEVKVNIANLLIFGGQVSQIILFAYIIELIGYWCVFIYEKYRENKFIRERIKK